MSEEAEARPQTHRRMRSLLRNYYGIQEDNTPQNVDPLSLDSSSFDKDKFLQKQLRTKKLTALTSAEIKLKKGRISFANFTRWLLMKRKIVNGWIVK